MFDIGTSLREARLRHGFDLVEAEQATKIRAKYLKALEEERFELLPAQTYVKGFLRSYAEYLGLDGQLYVDEYNSRYVNDEEPAPRIRRTPQSRAHRRVESSVLLIALAGIAAAAALVIVAWKFGGNETPPIAGVGNPPAAKTPKQAQAPKKAKKWIAVELSAVKGSSRVAVYRGSTDGRLLWEGILEQGSARSFTGPRVWLLLSEPSNLLTRVNGRVARLPGDGTRPIVAVATRKGITSARAA